jgi:hypothetical protein
MMDRAAANKVFMVERAIEKKDVNQPERAFSIRSFPEELQKLVKTSILATKPQLSTDIWYQDKESSSVYVMRHGKQWKLNETASFLWLKFNDGLRVSSIIKNLQKKYEDYNSHDIEILTIDFPKPK